MNRRLCLLLLAGTALGSPSSAWPGGPSPNPAAALANPEPGPPVSAPHLQDEEAEFKRRFAAAKEDYEALWELVDWCEANHLDTSKRRALGQLIKLEPEDAKARQLLGHVKFEGVWFTSARKLEAHQKKIAATAQREAKKRAKEEAKHAQAAGWVAWKDRWVHPDDLPFLERGYVRDVELGGWLSPEDVQHAADGWTRQDYLWIAPEDRAKVRDGQWKCGNVWLATAQADTYFGKLDRPWRIPSERFEVRTTLPRKFAAELLSNLDYAYEDLVRVYGIEPRVKPAVLVVSSTEQYKKIASWRPRKPGNDLTGAFSFHGAFFADGWLDKDTERHVGVGVANWDYATAAGQGFGRLFARHAAGQSFAEALDPSPLAVAEYFAKKKSLPRSSENRFLSPEAFWGEKFTPKWFRYGAASFVERYFTDRSTKTGGDPEWALKWAVQNIQERGGLSPLKSVFGLDLDIDKLSESEKLISEAGLVMAFVVNGKEKSVTKAHGALKRALLAAQLDPGKRSSLPKAFAKLEAAVLRKEKALRAFAGID